MLHGSFLLLTMQSIFHFSFFTLFIDKFSLEINEYPACVGLISHQGQSVSIKILSFGRAETVSRFSLVFSEL